jgi:hypothetical protein
MKKTLLIIGGALIVIIVVAIWVYLFMYGKPANSGEVFAKFGFGGRDTSGDIQPSVPSTPTDFESVVSTTPTKLRQLTTRPVGGAQFTDTGIRYVEQGTGHVYDINLTSGEETLVSGTTIPQTTSATFSNDGTHLTITSLRAQGTETIVGTITMDAQNGGEVDGVALPPEATEITFTEDGSGVYYAIKGTNGTIGYLFDIEKETSTEVFSIPLRDVHVLWGNPLYVYTTPTATQTGFLYRVENKNRLTYMLQGLPGLTAVRYGEGVVVSSITRERSVLVALKEDGTKVEQALPYIPEKCAVNPTDTTYVFCAVPINTSKGAFPDDWYMGTISYNDILWSMNTATGEATSMLNFLTESEQEMDVYHIGVKQDGMLLYFINKNDNTLWLYDRNVE